MTTAPPSLKADRQWLLDHFDMHPGTNAYTADLDPDEVGIVGDANHDGGYHCGKDRLVKDDYSDQTKRDRAGLSLAASALDIGKFAVKVGGRTYTQRDLAVWIVAQCQAGASDAADIREIIYSPDGKVVLRYDRERGQKSAPRAGESDDSHLTHNHISRYRDAEGRPLRPLFERWYTEITGGIMAADIDALYKKANDAATRAQDLLNRLIPMAADVAAIKAKVTGDLVDEQAVAARVLAGLTPASIATAVVDALPPELAREVVDELTSRLAA